MLFLWGMLVYEPGEGSEEGRASRMVFLGPIIKRPITAYVGSYYRGLAFSVHW
jgi:hypothetical protein